MAYPCLFYIFLVIASAMIPSTTFGKEHVVGDAAGWKLGFNYQAWAQSKNFRVGDVLVFKYQAGAHNVHEVNGTGFQSCIKPPLSEALTSGNDTIALATLGRKWYICGVRNHCQNGMKLVLTVQDSSQAPSSSPKLAPSLSLSSDHYSSPRIAPSPSVDLDDYAGPRMAPNHPSSVSNYYSSPKMAPSSPKVFIVGHEQGWRLGFDYQTWARGKEFHVGDQLVFNYQIGAHNVHKVNGTGFQGCTRPPVNEALTTGNDTIVLETPGMKWYICGVGKHCESGMKLALTVLDKKAPSPRVVPSPSSYYSTNP